MSATPPPPPPPPQGRPRPGGGGRDVVIAVVVGVVSALVAMVVTAVVVTITVRGGDGPEDVASAFLEESLALNVRLAGHPQRWCELGAERSRRELLEDSAAGDCAEFAAAREEELREQRARMAERCDAAAEVREGISWDIAITDVARAGGAARAVPTRSSRSSRARWT